MAYAILRTQKMSTNGQMGGMQKHNDRQGKTWSVKNADKDLTWRNDNWTLPETTNIIEAVEKNIKDHKVKGIRNDSVRCIEVLMTFSPEWVKFNKVKGEDGKYNLTGSQEDVDRWVLFRQEAFKFLQHKFGKNNLVNYSIHMDEKTPHIHAYVTPIVKKEVKWKNQKGDGKKIQNKLCARDFLGGYNKMQTLQDEFAQWMEPLGLERGVRGSTAKHENVKTYYGRVEKAMSVEKEVESFTPSAEYFEVPKPSSNPFANHDEYVRKLEEEVNKRIQEGVNSGSSQVKKEFSKEYHRVTSQRIIQRDLQNKIKATEQAHKQLMKEKDAEIAKKDGEIAKKALELQKVNKDIEEMKEIHEDMLNAALEVMSPHTEPEERKKAMNKVLKHHDDILNERAKKQNKAQGFSK